MREGNVSAKMHVGCSQARDDQRRLGIFGRGVSAGKAAVILKEDYKKNWKEKSPSTIGLSNDTDIDILYTYKKKKEKLLSYSVISI